MLPCCSKAHSAVAPAGSTCSSTGHRGTGKTEFCHVLARHVGAEIFSVGETDDLGGEPTRRERLQELCLSQCLLREGRDALLLFDEMEDLLADFGGMPYGRSRTFSVVVHAAVRPRCS